MLVSVFVGMLVLLRTMFEFEISRVFVRQLTVSSGFSFAISLTSCFSALGHSFELPGEQNYVNHGRDQARIVKEGRPAPKIAERHPRQYRIRQGHIGTKSILSRAAVGRGHHV